MGESQQRSGSGSSTIVHEVMEEEWTALQSEDQRLPSLWGPQGMAEVGLSPWVSLLATCTNDTWLYRNAACHV